MNARRQTNTWLSGMNMDLDYSMIKNSQYNYAENIRVVANNDNTSGSLQNIEGFIKSNPSLSLNNETIIHTATIRDLAIVFTKINGSNNVNIYRYDFSTSDENPQAYKIVDNVDLDIKPSKGNVYAISSVCNWENDNNVKIYWCDGQSTIKVLNVDSSHDTFNKSISLSNVSILPKATLPPLQFNGFGSGALKAGKIQYCYQLFNTRSSETALSVLSNMITISSNEESGNITDDNTGKSVRLTVDLSNTSNTFTRAKIISIRYKNNTSIPEIYVIGDIVLSNNVLSYEDTGSNILSELSIDELNSLASYPFIPEAIDSKDNILFAANVTESTWDISDYDTRSYRSNTSNEVRLLSSSGQSDILFNINELTTDTVPVDHDCICPYNSDDTSEYKYSILSDGSTVLGGKGLNIDYEFITTELTEDVVNASVEGSTESFNINSTSTSVDNLTVYRSNTSGNKTGISTIKLSSSTSNVNYSNSEIDSKVRGLQRDEIYRYGIVFYNDSNLASPVHWIADIRTPKANDLGYETFSYETLSGADSTSKKYLRTKPLGIRFTIRNTDVLLSNGVTGFDIVRCERTVSDRRVLMQGIVSDVVKLGLEEWNGNELSCMPYLSYYANNYGYYTTNNDELTSDSGAIVGDDFRAAINLGSYRDSQYFTFISPELCVNRDNTSEILSKAKNLQCVASLDSNIGTNRCLLKANKIKDVDSGTYKSPTVTYDGSTYNFEQNGNTYPIIVLSSKEDEYSATLAKYYTANFNSTSSNKITSINSIKYAPEIETYKSIDGAYRSDGVLINNRVFYNFVDTNPSKDHRDHKARKVGPHGICAVFNSSNMINDIPRLTSGKNNSVILCNLIQNTIPYGGNSYSAKQNSTYISTGSYHTITTENINIDSFGGDTYIGVLDYSNGMFCFDPSDYTNWSSNRFFNGAYFPVESTINLSKRNDEFRPSKTATSDGYANHYVQNDIISIGNVYSQSKPLYSYNDAYSSQGNAIKFVSKSIYSIDNITNDTRVHYSEIKTNNEVTDSWTKFKVANYLDVDTKYGPITCIKSFGDNIYFWQTDAFGVLPVNERSLITDNNPGELTLGKADILQRYSYITIKNGLKENQLRAVVTSDSTIYWYDYDRNEICSFNSSLNTLSKIKGVQSYLVNDKYNFSIDPSTAYDKKYNEVLFTLENKTLVYNEQLNAFTSFYTISPDRWVEFSDKIFTFKDLQLYKYNAGDDLDLYTGEDKVSYIQFTVNDDYPITKTFDNVEYSGDFTYKTNFYSIIFNTKRQTSYETTDEGIDYREDTYKFAIPRNNIELNDAENLVNKSYKDRMKGKYLVCNYKYDCNGGNTFKVPYISTAYRYSMI